ncbi:MAG: hypothetical protein K2O44_01525 [Clostridia bacterium]|nr:hypothetical protein [Clostridia bacterium]
MKLNKFFSKIFRKNADKPKKQNEPKPDINPNDKINYNEFDLLDELNCRAFESFALTLDKENFVPSSFLDQVCKWIYKVEKKRYRKLKKANKLYQKWFKVHLPQLIAERQQKLQQEQLQQLKAAEAENKENVTR